RSSSSSARGSAVQTCSRTSFRGWYRRGMVNESLAKSFENIGEEYDRYRPGFPSDAALTIIPEPVAAVLDLGAGTGKFTRELISRADRVIAVEPSAAMLDVLRDKLPGVEALQ